MSDGTITKKKVAIFAPVPAPYRAYEYDKIQIMLGDMYDFRCFFMEERYDMQWKNCMPLSMPYEMLPPSRLWNLYRKFLSSMRVNRGVVKKLSQFNPDFVIAHGYDSPTLLIAVLWAKLHGKKVIFRSDSNADSLRTKKKKWYKNLFVRTFFKMVDKYLTIGTKNEEYNLFFGAKEENFCRASYVVNTEFYQSKSDIARKSLSAIKEKYNIHHDKVLLFVGRFLKFKRINVLMDAFNKVKQTPGFENLSLALIGKGPEEESIKAMSNPIKESVYFLGFLQAEQVAEVMGMSDAFVLPSSSEPWGLVVNEAMECALPIIASDTVGSAYDLVKPGVNGYFFETDNSASLAEVIKKIFGEPGVCESMRGESRRLITEWNSTYDVVKAYKNVFTGK